MKYNVNAQGEPYGFIYEQVNDRWEVALTVSERGFQQVSFANSIATTKVRSLLVLILTFYFVMYPSWRRAAWFHVMYFGVARGSDWVGIPSEIV